jgi:hypothetical protein
MVLMELNTPLGPVSRLDGRRQRQRGRQHAEIALHGIDRYNLCDNTLLVRRQAPYITTSLRHQGQRNIPSKE